MHIYPIIAVLLLMLALYLWYVPESARRLAKRPRPGEPQHSGDRRQREIFEHASDAVFVVEVLRNGKYRFENLNPAALQMLDPADGGLAQRRLDDVALHVPGYVTDTLCENLDQAVRSGMPVRYQEAFHIAAAGEPKTYDLDLIPMVDDEGLSHILCFGRDVTARKLYEQELIERIRLEERISGFAASAPGFFFSFRHGADGSNAMPFASTGISKLFGLQPEDVAGSIAQMNLRIHPDDMEEFIKRMARSAADLSPFNIEFRVQHPQRGELWVEARAVPVAQTDGSIVWHGFMHDVSGRKRMEEELRHKRESLAEAQRIGQMGSWELNLSNNELTWSDEVFRIFEIDRNLFDASYEAFLNAVHPEDRDAVDKAYADSLASHTPYSIDHRLLFPDGRIKHVHECGESMCGDDGSPLRTHGTVQDITALKVVEQQLKDTQDKLRELVISRELLREDERKRIAWEMHEELGQILSGMKMRVSGLRSKLSKEAQGLAVECQPLNELIDQSISVVRNIVSDLRPTVLLHGVVASLEWLVAEFNKHPGMLCELSVDEAGDFPASDELSTLVFRVAQEALEDAMRHSGVSAVGISWVSSGDGHCMTIKHDGHCEAADLTGSHSLRLFGMQERVSAFGGELRVSAQAQRGAVIEVSFPA